MQISRKSQWIIFGCVNVSIFLIVFLFPLYLALARILPIGECGLVSSLGMYCPACGGTRALASLLRFELIESIKYNPIVLVFALGFAAYEIFMVAHLIKGKPRELFVNTKVIYLFLALWLLYTLARNVLLIFGIDMLGDIL